MLHAVTPLVICGAFVFGIVLALIGSLKLTLVRKLELRETHVGCAALGPEPVAVAHDAAGRNDAG